MGSAAWRDRRAPVVSVLNGKQRSMTPVLYLAAAVPVSSAPLSELVPEELLV
jgi:hypothetical protein